MKMNSIGFKTLVYADLISEIPFKKELLYFDKIVLDRKWFDMHYNFTSQVANLKGIFLENLRHNSNEIEFLSANNLLEIVDTDVLSQRFPMDEKENYSKARRLGDEFLDKLGEEVLKEGDINPNEAMASLMYYSKFVNTGEVRLFCRALEDQQKYVPVIDSLELPFEFLEKKTDTIISLVLKKFPIPSDSSSWDEILEFKQDEDSKRKLLALKSWIVDVGYSNLTKIEVEQKMEHLLVDYERSLKLHKIKYTTGNLELFVTTALGIAANLIKLDWSKAAQLIFDIKKRDIDLLIGETSLPGKELAYISKSNERFKPHGLTKAKNL